MSTKKETLESLETARSDELRSLQNDLTQRANLIAKYSDENIKLKYEVAELRKLLEATQANSEPAKTEAIYTREMAEKYYDDYLKASTDSAMFCFSAVLIGSFLIVFGSIIAWGFSGLLIGLGLTIIGIFVMAYKFQYDEFLDKLYYLKDYPSAKNHQ